MNGSGNALLRCAIALSVLMPLQHPHHNALIRFLSGFPLLDQYPFRCCQSSILMPSQYSHNDAALRFLGRFTSVDRQRFRCFHERADWH